MTTRPPDNRPNKFDPPKRKPIVYPSFEQVQRAIRTMPWLPIEYVAVLRFTSVDGVRKAHELGSIPAGHKRGRRWYWNTAIFVGWINGEMAGDEQWSPGP